MNKNGMLIQYIRNTEREKQGVMIAFKKDGKTLVGFSLCCKKDKWDGQWGFNLARARALVYDIRDPLRSAANVNFPDSIMYDLLWFIGSVQDLYGKEKISKWANDYMVFNCPITDQKGWKSYFRKKRWI